jgi:predicted MFS family arabinose efflux permease
VAKPLRARLDKFFHSDVQTGFGTFVAFYLAHLGWSHSSIGLVLTVGGIAALIGQIPGGRWGRDIWFKPSA